MDYKSIRRTLHMGESTERPQDRAEREYRARIEGSSTFARRHIARPRGVRGQLP